MNKLMIILSFCIVVFSSCKKDKQELSNYQANLTIVNGLVDKDGLIWKFNQNKFSFDQFRSFYFNNGYFDSEESVGMTINAPVPITVAYYNDTTKVIFKTNKVFNSGDLYTLYLSGKQNAIDTMMIREENLPYNGKDSVMSVRFINIAPEVTGLNVNLSGQGNEVTDLKYKGITAFKTYPAKAKDIRYTFEFHDSVTGELLGVYEFGPDDPNYRVPRFKTLSLIFKGLKSKGFRISRVDY